MNWHNHAKTGEEAFQSEKFNNQNSNIMGKKIESLLKLSE